jgi:hypothetical protein
MPGEVDNHNYGGGAMDDAPDIKDPAAGDSPLEELELVEEKRQSGDDEKKKSQDKEPVLDAFGPVHPQEDFIVPNERRAIHVFPF